VRFAAPSTRFSFLCFQLTPRNPSPLPPNNAPRQPWEDPTNSDTRIARNAVRLNVLPLMAQINPGAVRHLASLAELLAADVDCLEAAAGGLLRQVEGGSGGGGAGCGDQASSSSSSCSSSGSRASQAEGQGLDRFELRAQHVALQRRALRLWLRGRLGVVAPTFEQVEAARRLLDAPNRSKSSTMRGGVWLEVEGRQLVLKTAVGSSSNSSSSSSSSKGGGVQRQPQQCGKISAR